MNPDHEQDVGARHIVIIDDDDLFREAVERNLTQAGFRTRSFATGCEALARLSGDEPTDLVLLDWKMPEMSGIDVLRRLREQNALVPVILLTVLCEQLYEEAALNEGAVDFVEKSRSFAILLRRIELILEGHKGARSVAGPTLGEPRLTLDKLTLDRASSRAYWRNERVNLTLTEFRIVERLVLQSGQDVGYRELYDLVHGDGFVAGEGEHGYRANIRTFIKRIREKFSKIDDNFDAIKNYPGFGYRWE